MVLLEVSIAEALDKLSILEIKLQKITDNRKLAVQKEYDTIYPTLEPYIEKSSIYYNLLKHVNTDIWDLMDNLRDNKDNFTQIEYSNICIKCIDENDRRFRIKNKINNLLNSNIKEQKGYNVQKALIIVTNISLQLVRYLSTVYDYITIYNLSGNKDIYSVTDDITINVIEPVSNINNIILDYTYIVTDNNELLSRGLNNITNVNKYYNI